MAKSKKTNSFPITFLVICLILVGGYVFLITYLPLKYYDLIEEYSEEFGLEPQLVCTVISAESRYDEFAVSKVGAMGLMQLMENTALWGAEELEIEGYSREMLFEPHVNIRIGCWYLAKLLDQYNNTETALAAYNAGSGNVSQWLKNADYSDDGVTLKKIPFPETDNYLKKINRKTDLYKFLIDYLGGFYGR